MSGPVPAISHEPLGTDPLVSVVMTARDAKAQVLEAARSILEQTWRHLELVIVDDQSSDGTLEALARLNDPRIKLWRNQRQAGPQFCRNFGIRQSAGAFVALQDASDVSAPRRIEEQVRYLFDNPDVKICQGRYVPVDGHHKPLSEPRPALRAVLMRRDVFDEIGFYDTARVDADDEFDQRARAFYGGLRVAVLPELLSVQRNGSVPFAPEGVEQRSDVAEPEADAERFQRVGTVAEKVTATVATHKGRIDALLRVVEDIVPQVDELRVYLNDHDEVPPPLRDRPGVTTFLGRTHAGDLADNGKFYELDGLQGYHFTLDDDIRYPPDYIRVLKERIDAYGGQAVVGVHGIVIRYERFKSYYEPGSRDVYHYGRANPEDRPVHVLGTGTVGYHTRAFALDFFALDHKFMADILFALQAHRRGVPMICVAHAADWLLDQAIPDGASIYRTRYRDDAVQSRLVTQAQFALRLPERLLAPATPTVARADASRREGPAKVGSLVAPRSEAEVDEEWLRLLQESRAAVKEGRHAQALHGYAAARAIRPLGAEDLHGLGLCLVRANNLPAGIEVLVKAATLAPEVEAHAESLAAALEASVPRHRVEVYTELVARRPDALRFRRDLAAALLQAGEPGRALQLFDRPAGSIDRSAWERAGYHVARQAGRPVRALGFLARAFYRRLQHWMWPGHEPVAERSVPAPHDMQENLDAADRAYRELKWEYEELKTRRTDEEARRVEATQEVATLRASLDAMRAEREAAREALIVASSERDIALALRRDDHARLGPAGEAIEALRVACVVDEFTYASYRPECNALALTPQRWRRELEAFAPELLFVEAAWRGKEDLWGGKVAHRSDELMGIVAWCRERGVPTVFWNKEDPVHFDTFLNTAKLFDFVFTTDIDCIHRYKRALGHDRVYLLPFACQPRLAHPIEAYDRKDAFCFAGAYYVRYPERTRDLETFVSTLAAFRPVEIYDRNQGKDDPNYQFPPKFQRFIVGNLPFEHIDRAYKGYRYAINLNSIKQSQSMFARRVIELLASNTVTISNFSRGLRLFFGDLVVATDSGSEMVRRVETLGADEVRLRKHRLAGLRKVIREHTYQDRFAYLVGKVRGGAPAEGLPRVVVTGFASDPRRLDALVERFTRQAYPYKRLVVLVPHGFPRRARQNDDDPIEVLTFKAAGEVRIGDLLEEGEWLSALSTADHHGPNFLLDLALATRYSRARAFGKVARYVWSQASRRSTLASDGSQYRATSSVPARAALVHRDVVQDLTLRDWLATLETRQVEGVEALALDEFNYCEGGGSPAFLPEHAAVVDDLPGLDAGLGMAEILRRAEQIEAEVVAPDEAPVLTGGALATYFKAPSDPSVRCETVGAAWEVVSSLPEGKHTYLYASTNLRPDELGFSKQWKVHLDATPGLNLQVGMLFFDAAGARIGHVVKTANRNHEGDLPEGTAHIGLALRVRGSGAARVNSLVLGHRPVRPATVIARGDYLLLTNHYPTYDDLYRNAFVHSRVRAYRERGARVDVFRLRSGEGLSHHEFEDVDVLTGSQEALDSLLSGGQYKTVLVHFLDAAMWEVLQRHVGTLKVLVWVHGAEIHPWHRRDFNLANEQQREAAKVESEHRMTFWRGLLAHPPTGLKLVFVSRHLAEEAMEDLGFRLPAKRYAIIHNPIDTELFSYREKSPEHRKKVLSIRPYASRQYANDLSVEAILSLRKQSWFGDIEFRLIGNGALFEETLEPLRSLDNVVIERRFLTHSEIAALHREYGIFLCPTRWDSQGVSRDEAMASGLAPITNRVAAIPEFVDDECGVLADPEDAEGLARGIASLVEDPARFLAMSRAAAERVRSDRAASQMIGQELVLFAGDLS